MEMGGSDAYGRPEILLPKPTPNPIPFQFRYLVPECPLLWRINHSAMNGVINLPRVVAAGVTEYAFALSAPIPPKTLWAIQLVAWRCCDPLLSQGQRVLKDKMGGITCVRARATAFAKFRISPCNKTPKLAKDKPQMIRLAYLI